MDRSNGMVKSDLLRTSAIFKRVFWCFASSPGEGVFVFAGMSPESEEAWLFVTDGANSWDMGVSELFWSIKQVSSGR